MDRLVLSFSPRLASATPPSHVSPSPKPVGAPPRVNSLSPVQGELVAFAAYAQSFPDGFIALVDTYVPRAHVLDPILCIMIQPFLFSNSYDVNASGVPNFCAVALALHELGHAARGNPTLLRRHLARATWSLIKNRGYLACTVPGVRLDSGDLAYLSLQTRRLFEWVATEYVHVFPSQVTCPVLTVSPSFSRTVRFNVPQLTKCKIIASNDINESTLWSIRSQVTNC